MPNIIKGLSRTESGKAQRSEAARKAKLNPPAKIQAVKFSVDVTEEIITPDLAALYLEENKAARSIRDAKVDRYADDMRNNRWQLNGSTIVFDKDKNLLDGQHRLWACFQSKCNFRTLVARGVDPKAFETIDTGIPRPTTDIFKIAGESNVGALASATRLLFRYEENTLPAETKQSLSSQVLLEFLNKHPRLRDSAERVSHIPNLKRLMTPSGAVFTHYLLWNATGNAAAEEFLTKLGRGDQLPVDHPIFRAREVLVNSLGKRGDNRGIWASAIVIKAWNFNRKGKKVKAISWSPTKNEEFPRPII